MPADGACHLAICDPRAFSADGRVRGRVDRDPSAMVKKDGEVKMLVELLLPITSGFWRFELSP
jgi:hypothetical protein